MYVNHYLFHPCTFFSIQFSAKPFELELHYYKQEVYFCTISNSSLKSRQVKETETRNAGAKSSRRRKYKGGV